MADFVKGELYQLKVGLSNSTVFKKNTIIRITRNATAYELSSRCYESLDGKQYNGWNYMPASHLVKVTEEEVRNMNKPVKYIAHIVGSTNYQRYTTEEQKNKGVAQLLTANPTAEIAVYSLDGIATAVPVEVKFTFAQELRS